MSQNLFKKSRENGPAASDEDKIAVNLFFKHASILLSRYEQWKDIDRFYFIPLKLDMAYFCGGGTFAVAYPPYFIGTVIRNSLEHPELFASECECGNTAYAYSYNGSPLSGRFDLSYACPCCGRHFTNTKSGWLIRSMALNETQDEDLERGHLLQCLSPSFEPSDIKELLHFCNVDIENVGSGEPGVKPQQ